MSIIFLMPTPKNPVGGVKVMYQNCETLLKHGFMSEIIHTDNLMGQCDWLSYEVVFRRELRVDPLYDLVIIPEGATSHFAKTCLELGVPYCIYVQNGYLAFNDQAQSSRADLEFYYNNSEKILSISEDTTKTIKYLHSDLSMDKIIRLYPKINSKLFYAQNNRKKKIAIMSRKLPLHAHILLYFLERKLPKAWGIIEINGKSEVEVAEILRESSIFLSLSDLEGFGLPPLEAAFSGNLVVGYTGQGGNEYFHEPIFRRVENGDFLSFSKRIIDAIEEVENGIYETTKYKDHLEALQKHYSEELYEKRLIDFANKVKNTLKHKVIVP